MFDQKIKKELVIYLNNFFETRRMKRDNDLIKAIYPNWNELCFHGNLGIDGEYFTPNPTENENGQNMDKSILEYSFPPSTQPRLWCDWCIYPEIKNKDKSDKVSAYLAWDQSDKFYDYVEWLKYLIKHFFIPSGLSITGVILAIGEQIEEATYIIAKNNQIQTYNVCSTDIKNINAIYSGNSELINRIAKIKITKEELIKSNAYYDYRCNE